MTPEEELMEQPYRDVAIDFVNFSVYLTPPREMGATDAWESMPLAGQLGMVRSVKRLVEAGMIRICE